MWKNSPMRREEKSTSKHQADVILKAGLRLQMEVASPLIRRWEKRRWHWGQSWIFFKLYFVLLVQGLCSYPGRPERTQSQPTSCMDNICQQLNRYQPARFLLLLTQTILNTTTSAEVISSSRLSWLAFLPFFPGSLFHQHSGVLGWALHQVPQ